MPTQPRTTCIDIALVSIHRTFGRQLTAQPKPPQDSVGRTVLWVVSGALLDERLQTAVLHVLEQDELDVGPEIRTVPPPSSRHEERVRPLLVVSFLGVPMGLRPLAARHPVLPRPVDPPRIARVALVGIVVGQIVVGRVVEEVRIVDVQFAPGFDAVLDGIDHLDRVRCSALSLEICS
jgi:hypothetical protein